MPLYDVVLMVKNGVARHGVAELLQSLGQRVYARGGVVTDVKSFDRVNLAYDIKPPRGLEGGNLSMGHWFTWEGPRLKHKSEVDLAGSGGLTVHKFFSGTGCPVGCLRPSTARISLGGEP